MILKYHADHPTSDEIDDYLTAPVVIAIDRVTKKPINVLVWWKVIYFTFFILLKYIISLVLDHRCIIVS